MLSREYENAVNTVESFIFVGLKFRGFQVSHKLVDISFRGFSIKNTNVLELNHFVDIKFRGFSLPTK